MAETVLVVDDEPQIVRVVKGYLENAGYRVLTASNGEEALRWAQQERPDLVVLDLLMPKMDGMALTQRLRAEMPEVAIIMLTARVEEMDRIMGLKMGADDYVTKPFSPRELVARVEAVLRRIDRAAPKREVLRVGDLTLDLGSRTAGRGGTSLDLTPAEFKVLAAMMRAPGQALSRERLLEAAQGVAFEAYARTIDVHIKNLRQKLAVEAEMPDPIKTVRGVGYRIEDVT
jgi:two-component system alkaline phosphatase synthesis response regulator PhoP